jgi:hypothetical protein
MTFETSPSRAVARAMVRAVVRPLAVAALFASAPLLAQQAAPEQAPAGSGIQREARFPAIAQGAWTGKRLADGQPDVQGHWSNTIANHNNWTDPQGGIPGDPQRSSRPQGPREARAPSRVSDPADGQVPFQPWARAKQQEFLKNFHNPIEPWHIEPLARCAPAGVPKTFTWHGFEIRQYPGYVLFQFNSGYRLIHLDAKPHLDAAIKLWNADSRGHWEGNTLVVDVTNNNAKALFGRTGEFASENVHIVERYVFNRENDRFNYIATVTDPSVYTRPWTATIPVKRWTEKDTPNGWHYEASPANAPGKPRFDERDERICTENNGGFGMIGSPVTPAPDPPPPGG